MNEDTRPPSAPTGLRIVEDTTPPMETTTLEGWTVPLGPVDHTFVYCPEEDSCFYCFDPLKQHKKTSGAKKVCTSKPTIGAYCRANHYRRTILLTPDTAGIGIYAINGVCHQATNCFLYSADTSLPYTFNIFSEYVKGYFGSTLLYGFYGTDPLPGTLPIVAQAIHFRSWRTMHYLPAEKACKASDTLTEAASVVEPPLHRRILDLHNLPIDKNQEPPTAHDMIKKEANLITQHCFPDVDASKFEDIHQDLLKEKDAILKSETSIGEKPKEIKLPQGKKAEDLVTKMNDLIVNFQKALLERIGPAKYEQLTGSKEAHNIIDPRSAVENWKKYQ